MKNIALLCGCLFLLVSIKSNGQQGTGSFLQTDGGFEGEPNASLANSLVNNTPTSLWSRCTPLKCSNIHGIYKIGARTGNYLLGLNDTLTTGIANAISPALASGAVIGGQPYIVQFFYKAKDSINMPSGQLTVGVSNATGTSAKMTAFVPNPSPNPAVWLKSVTPVIATSGKAPSNGFIAFGLAGVANNNKKPIAIDDVVMYAGTVADTVAPANPGILSVGNATSSTLDVSWGASADVDGGGYMVVRYTSDPTSQADPNPNGIYAVGNKIDSGVVVYTGVDTSFTDNQLAAVTPYYYRVYSVDKAFNYSVSSVGIGYTNNGQALTTYYVDSIAGSDANDGHTPLTAWKTITKVNSITFSAGDSILFLSGCSWSGITLHPLGSGVSGNPIVISSYGTGNLPLINGNTATSPNENAVFLYNQDYVTISNLEITNDHHIEAAKDSSLKKGVYVLASNYGTMHGITLQNLVIHNVLGSYNKDVNTGGIFCNISGSGKITTFDSLLIDHCKVYNVDLTGISNESSWAYLRSIKNDSGWYPSTHLVIQNCEVDSIGGNSIIVRAAANPIVQYCKVYKGSWRYTGNSIFAFNCDDATFQYNEVSFNKFNTGDRDASAYDADYRCHRTVFQYNYSHDNDGGAFVVVCDPNYANTFDDSCVIRYNISQNDAHKAGGKEGAAFRIDGLVTNTLIYNNTIYTSTDFTNVVYHCAWGGGTSGTLPTTTSYYNNIFYLNKSKAGFTVNSSKGNTFSHNTYFYGAKYTGTHPTDAAALTTDPLFINPGKASLGINTVDGYKLQPTSPCVNTGLLLANHSPIDFWGNPVPGTAGLAPCRGAFEYSATLPVKLVGFKGENVGNTNLLSWTTTEEINNAGFQIQHSVDGLVFTDEHFVPTKIVSGNYAGIINYTYTDANPYQGINYYRLKQIDKAGNQTFSSVIEITVKKLGTGSFSVFPNPVTNKVINIQFNNQSANTYTVRLISNDGKVVARKQINHAGGNSLDTFDISNLNVKGIYFLKIASSEGETTKTVFIK